MSRARRPGLKAQDGPDVHSLKTASEQREAQPLHASPTSPTVIQGGRLALCISQDLRWTAGIRVFVHAIYQPDWNPLNDVVRAPRGVGSDWGPGPAKCSSGGRTASCVSLRDGPGGPRGRRARTLHRGRRTPRGNRPRSRGATHRRPHAGTRQWQQACDGGYGVKSLSGMETRLSPLSAVKRSARWPSRQTSMVRGIHSPVADDV